jgi:hypothetical protein
VFRELVFPVGNTLLCAGLRVLLETLIRQKVKYSLCGLFHVTYFCLTVTIGLELECYTRITSTQSTLFTRYYAARV